MGEIRKNLIQAEKNTDDEGAERENMPVAAIPVKTAPVTGDTAHNMNVSRILQDARKKESVDKLRNRLRRVQRKLKETEA